MKRFLSFKNVLGLSHYFHILFQQKTLVHDKGSVSKRIWLHHWCGFTHLEKVEKHIFIHGIKLLSI